MSHLRFCLFSLLVLGVGYAVSDICKEEVVPNSESVTMGFIEKRYKRLSKSPKTASANEVEADLSMIFPGTMWCGDGNKARSENHTGFWDADKCCRDHDNCHSNIEAGHALLNLKNDGAFTRSHCECDNAFHACLKSCGKFDMIAKTIGKTYFNMLSPQCFQCRCSEDGDESSCTRFEWIKCKSF